MNRSRRGPNTSQIDVSIDHEYLGKVDEMELQNQQYAKEIDKMKTLMEAEKQKMVMLAVENEKLQVRID